MPGYATVDHSYGLQLATTAPEDDGPVWMVNLMHYKERAAYADGRETRLLVLHQVDHPQGPVVIGGGGGQLEAIAVVDSGVAGHGYSSIHRHTTFCHSS